MDPEKLKQLSDIFANINVDSKGTEKPEKKQRKKREYTDEAKEKMRERMAKMREISLLKRQSKAEEKKKNPPKKINDEVDELKKELENLKLKLSNTNKTDINDNKNINTDNVAIICPEEIPPTISTNNKIINLTNLFKQYKKPVINNIKNPNEIIKPIQHTIQEIKKPEPAKIQPEYLTHIDDINKLYGSKNNFF
jgi:hypothetical protein